MSGAGSKEVAAMVGDGGGVLRRNFSLLTASCVLAPDRYTKAGQRVLQIGEEARLKEPLMPRRRGCTCNARLGSAPTISASDPLASSHTVTLASHQCAYITSHPSTHITGHPSTHNSLKIIQMAGRNGYACSGRAAPPLCQAAGRARLTLGAGLRGRPPGQACGSCHS